MRATAMTTSCFAAVVMLAGRPSHEADWTALNQRPFEGLNIEAVPLPPLIGNTICLTSPRRWQASRTQLVSQWTEMLGTPPEKPPSLDVETHHEDRLPGFTRRLLSFHAEGGDRIKAAVLLPGDLQPGERRPAVVVFHETTPLTFRQPSGMEGNPDRHFGVELVRRGYVVLCPECFILKRSEGAVPLGPINVARVQAAELRKRRPGWTGMGKMTFDASRCVDFLETLASVDKDRVGCLGFSLGAKEVVYAMALEPRYRAGVANEGGIGIRMSNWSDDWYLGPSIKDRLATMDHHQLLALAAPRAILIQGGGSADGRASWPFVTAALPVYRLLAAPDRIGLHDHGGKHTFPSGGRLVAYRWLDHWLGHQPRPADPP